MLSTKESKSANKARIGKFILDTLSIGMYNNALMLLREYVQNSVDAIDAKELSTRGSQEESCIDIEINGRTRSIIISDNGSGISASDSWNSLHDLGRSFKRLSHNRGFRGIGRLGGLGYCSQLKFITKARGEKVYTVSEWDCKKLRGLLSHDDHSIVDVAELIDEVVNYNQFEYHEDKEDHFFKVELHDVYSSRDVLLNVPAIKSYLSQVAPVPFNIKQFKYSDRIGAYLEQNVPHYKTYRLLVNKEQIFKPYTNDIAVGKGTSNIKDVKLIELKDDGRVLAYGWLGVMDLAGSINPTSGVDGIRLRMGNILVGDNYTACDLFRERRFNNYLLGEMHIISHKIIPNSRRDDFEDNKEKDELFNAFIKEIGLPYSKEIRDASKARSSSIQLKQKRVLLGRAKKLIKEGYVSASQKGAIITMLKRLKAVDGSVNGNVDALIAGLNKAEHCVDRLGKKIKPAEKAMLKSVLNVIYKKSSNKDEAAQIAGLVVKTYLN